MHKKAISKQLKVAEKFVSIQGEGRTQGLPTIFIRLHGCNLSCDYCDTEYATSSDATMNFEKIDDIINWAAEQFPDHVCLTGGEPLIHEGIHILIIGLVQAGKKVEIETNGTIDIESMMWLTASVMDDVSFVMDYKMPSVQMSKSFRENTFKNLKDLALSGTDEIKFVVKDEKEVKHALSVINQYEIENPVISPVLSEGEISRKNLQKILSAIMKGENPNIKFQVQMHKIIYGDQRGV